MKSQLWLGQYHSTNNIRNTGFTEVVDKVPASETNAVLLHFCDLISSTYISNEQQQTNKCLRQYHPFRWN